MIGCAAGHSGDRGGSHSMDGYNHGYDLRSIDPTKPETYMHLPYWVVRAAAERQRDKHLRTGQELYTGDTVTVQLDRDPASPPVSEVLRALLSTPVKRRESVRASLLRGLLVVWESRRFARSPRKYPGI
jgi:hypothetical protein